MINRAALNPTVAPPGLRVSRPLYLLGAALLLLVLQLMSGTGVVYALLVFALLIVSYAAVSSAGGLESLFGLAILYLLLQHVLVSQVAKVFFWEPADAPLRQPVATMGVYVVGTASLALGALLASRLRRRKAPLFVAEVRPSRLLWLTIFSTIFSAALTLVGHIAGTDPNTGGAAQGGVLGPLKQLALVGPLAIVCGTAYMIKSSGGRRSFGLVNGIPIALSFAAGFLNATRESLAAPVIIYVLTCIAFRFRFRAQHFALLLFGAYVANFILFPTMLIARGLVHTASFEVNVERSAGILGEIIQEPFKYRDLVDHLEAKRAKNLKQFDYYSHSSLTLDRYTVINFDDGVVDAAINHGDLGWETITPGFEASLPRFINPDKPFLNAGNTLAQREPGLLPNKHDHTTGITLGFYVDAFSSFGWLGISVIPCLLMFCFMQIYRLLIDERIWNNVLVLSLLVQTLWTFSEATIANMIVVCLTGAFATAFGFLVLYMLAYAFDRLTHRVRDVWAAHGHPRQQALRRVLTTNPHLGDLMDVERLGPF